MNRVLSSARSGRASLQEIVPARSQALNRSTYFLAQHNARRQALARDVNLRLIGGAGLTDRLGHIPELAGYDCFALDAHWHRAASHDPQEGTSKPSVGHLYSLNLHSHLMRHLTVGEGVHEHDLSMLKRVKSVGLRHEVPKGRRVLLVYDRAGIDYAFSKRCRQECAVYFLIRTKEGMKFDWIRQRESDRQDPRNAAVSEDWQVVSPEGHTLRVIRYTEPLRGRFYEFLTNEMDLPPGVLAELYRRR